MANIIILEIFLMEFNTQILNMVVKRWWKDGKMVHNDNDKDDGEDGKKVG